MVNLFSVSACNPLLVLLFSSVLCYTVFSKNFHGGMIMAQMGLTDQFRFTNDSDELSFTYFCSLDSPQSV